MDKIVLAQARGYTYRDNFDTALPQEWVDRVTKVVKPSMRDVKRLHVADHFIWLYTDDAPIFGRPVPVSRLGDRILWLYALHHKGDE